MNCFNQIKWSNNRTKTKLTKNTRFFAGPNSWWFFYPNQCDSLLFPNQSPVKLDAQDGSLVVTRSFQKLDFKGFELAPSELILLNDGSGLTLKPVYANESQIPSLSGGPLIPERKYFLVSTSRIYRQSPIFSLVTKNIF